ncbi:hypothetical protein [Paenibacillus oleatilyticus]|uniref:hypothetical protein n=1 Tax=Paenibacillus oleatilyticus TaxID=2594886 RepID=UPI001C1FE817|nr:hypothetical protein [Paenibacillus oleatilyticus]MBU7319523.1 hypothetical protein [Paenibacillus oleatilyticus]
MSIGPQMETEEDIQIIKDYTLLPVLLDMLARDIDELQIYKDRIVYNHVIFYLKEIEKTIYSELLSLKNRMRKENIKILVTEMNASGIEVEYKVRGYIHHFKMLRSLVKAELMTLLMNLRRRTG